MKLGEFKIQMMDPKKLKPVEGNPNHHGPRAKRELELAIKQLGFKVPILARPDGMILDGHLRREVALKLKLKEVPVVITDMEDDKILVLMASIKKIGELSEWDPGNLAEILETVGNQKIPGFDDAEETAALLAIIEKPEKEKSVTVAKGSVRRLMTCPNCRHEFTSSEARAAKKVKKRGRK